MYCAINLFPGQNTIFNSLTGPAFTQLALDLFRFQYANNAVYRQWTDLLRTDVGRVSSVEEIPFLPIECFKRFAVVSSPVTGATVEFTSSATTSQVPAKHYVNDIGLYEKSFLNGFQLFYGDPRQYCILALLPNYLQRKGSSLVYMCKELISRSGHALSGFYLDNVHELIATIEKLKRAKQRTLLIGVSYALMDLCDRGVALSDDFIVMETGGMKGTRKELLKPELHAYLSNGFKISTIHSEYGMTELLSQAYSRGDGTFEAPPWMRFLVREVDDPLRLRSDGKTGGINVIDLANVYSCAFIATKDLGRLLPNGTLELMGRYDHSDVRGCNLMVGGF